jgi:hypothetical protein
MALLHLHHDDLRSVVCKERFPITWALERIGAGLRWLHRAIVNAKLRSLKNELMFRRDYDEMFATERDVVKYPQRPLILGDKWDF